MSEGSLKTVRVEMLLRVFAVKLLKARSASAVCKALERMAGELDLSLVGVIPIEDAGISEGAPLQFGHALRGRRDSLDALRLLRSHPLFVETLAEGGPLTGSQIRKRRSLTPSAWQATLPPLLKGHETLSLTVRFEDHGQWRAAWLVVLSLRGARLSGLARSMILVAAHLAHDRFRAIAHEKCGRAPSARRANTALKLIASGASDVDVARVHASTRRASRRPGRDGRNGVH